MYQAPTVTIQVVYPGPAQEPSLFDLTVTSQSALNPLFPASGTVYDAWCLNLLAAINTPGTYVSSVYATNEAENIAVNVPPLANGLLLDNLDSVNWLLNYYDGTNAGISYGEVQGAIWKLMGQDWTLGARVLGQVDAADVDALTSLALANDGYAPAAGQTIGVVIAPNGNFVQPLIIETKAAALGNRVWADTDGDGVQDTGEAGIAGATVSLVRDLDGDGQFTGAGEVIATTTTNSQGNYLFQGLAPGVDYQVRFTLPNGFDAASPRQADGSATSDTNSDGLLSGVVVLAPGATNNTIDSGFYKFASLGDRVWLDTDKDGQQDANEVGVANVTVNLLDAAGNVVATQVTGGTGNYLFLGLNPGQYSVQFVAPTGFDFTTANSGADASDSDADTLTGRTQQVTLLSGDDNRTVDAGLVAAPPAPGTISGVVLEDLNNDGTGDTPIPGVTVVLKDSTGTPVATTTTGPDGSYSFAGVPPGQYTVQETNKPGYNDVSDTDGGNPNTISVTLPAGGTSAGNNFVDDRKATLGDRVWLDTDKDGQQDANEAGVAGVTVNLLNAAGTVVGTQTTNAQGNYLFTELDAGTYSVEFAKPTGLNFTSADTGADGSDSDADPTTGRTGPITLQSGDDDRTVDAGLVAAPVLLGKISGVVLEDLNNDDLGDRPIAGVTVVLKDSAGNPVATAVTGTDGSYTFDNLPEGNYTVEQTNLPGYNDVGDVDGGNPNVISVALPAGATRAGNNFIDDRKATLGDRVWLDTDKDGQQDANEAGVGGVTVNLLNAAGAVVGTQTTNAQGNYLFTELDAGTYSVEFVKPTGFDFTSANTGADASDSDVVAATGRTGQYTLQSGDDNRTVDAGLVVVPPQPGTISGVVLEDLNNDGTGDTPIPGVTVVLKDSTGTPVATTTTGPDGSYSFAGVPPGQYTVEETNKPGYNDVSDTDGGNPNTISVTLPAGGTSAGNNFVDDRKATLGDRVWLDTDKDGQQGANEAGVAGVTVNLLNAAGAVVGTQTTNAQGNYLFTELDAGTYSVEFVKPTGLDFTSADTGADGSDSDANTTTGRTGTYTLQSGDDNRTVDAGLVTPPPLPGTISGVVREDLNNDGTGDTPIPGVTVVLKDSTGTPVATTTTGTDGSYSFTNVPPGQYTVEETNKPGYNDVGDTDGGNPNSISVTLPAGGTSAGNDFVDDRKATLGDRVWLDTDKDGQQDANEAGVAGVTVNLLNAAGTVVGTQTTDGQGNYLFTELDAGTYSVEFVKPTGLNFTSTDTGADGSDSDANQTTGRTGQYTLQSGDDNRTVDAGLVTPPAKAVIGNLVFEDANANGVQDTGELGIAGATILLKDPSGAVVQTTTTDSNGIYSFEVDAGSYSLQVVVPADSGYSASPQNAGGDDTRDSDIDATGNTGLVTVAAGEVNNTIDMGGFRKASLGDRVWLDTDKDGQQDATEAGVAGVTVNLLNTAGTVVATQTTDGSGNYLFSDLTPGRYTVQFVKPNGFDFTSANTGDDASDSDANTTTGTTGEVVLNSGENIRTVDAGLVAQPPAPGTISGVVREDLNNDGTGDTPIPGVTVVLKDSTGTPVATTTTGTDGSYSFTNVPPGQYTVEETNKPGYNDVGDTDGGNPNSISVTLPAGGTSAGNDFVDDRKATLGDRVWLDTDKDGQQDANEAGVAGVTVNLLNAAGTVVGTQTTNAQGNYLFTELDAGTYSVEFVKPNGFDFTTRDTGADGSDSDASTTTGRTGTYTLQSGDDNRTVDAGLVAQPPAPGTISGVVREDLNNDGTGDTPIPGVTVVLKDSTGTPVATTTTGTDGSYSFTNVPPGQYTVEETNKPGYNDVGDTDGGNPNSISVTLPAGGTSAGNNFVDDRKATLGDRVWLDTDKDGQQDANEAGVAGVTLNLLNAAGAVVGTQTTNAQGNYLFTELDAGTYSVEFVKPNGFDFTTRDTGADGSDSDASTTTGRTGTYTLQSGDDNRTVDAGLVVKTGTISGVVLEDQDNNNSGDRPIPGVTVVLKDAAGNPVATTTTGTDGSYSFTNVPAGSYTVEQTNLPTYSDVGDVDGGNPNVISVTLPAGGTSTGNNFVDERKATLGDRVWLDTDKDGQQDANEAGVAGVTVNLLNAAGAVVGTQTTNAQGNYLFTELDAGTYSVEFVKPNGFDFTTRDTGADGSDSDASTTTGRTGTYTLQGGDDNRTVDAGLVVKQATLGDKVFEDKNANGVQDTGESGISGVTVQLKNAAGTVVATTTTGTDGAYSFTVDPGTYSVQVNAPAGFTASPTDQGGNDATDSDINASGATGSYTLAAGQTNNTVDAGLFKKATLGDRVWLDTDKDGQQDANEAGVAGVTVRLLNAAGAVVATQTTNASGNYLFTDLTPGTYSVEFVKPNGFNFTTTDTGADASDSDANQTTGRTGSYTLQSGDDVRTVDAGLVQPQARIGDTVFLDKNGNGVQDSGEGGIANVTVNLRDSAGTVVATTTTDANGKYGFDTAPGTYSVQVVAPNGYFGSPKDQGGNDATDSDIDANGLSPNYTLAAGENNTTVDAGLFQKASLGDKVWFDKDRDGVQDADEPGISHVTVKLLDAAGNVVATTETDAGGNYLFTNLNPGNYAVQFVAPTGYGFTKKDLGGDDTKDSDADLTTGKTAYTTLESGEVERGLDAGINPICRPVTYDFNGNTATDGTDGNVRSWTDSATGVVVTARAFSQDKGTNTWQNAFVGAYGGGLGVTDSSEGTGSGTTHTIDNTGRNNYIVLQFSQAVEVDKLFLGYVSGDSDLQVWVGNSATTITSMNNSVLAGMSFTEVNTTDLTTSRWADINAGGVVGNVLIIAADTTDTTPEDFFKLQNVALCAPDLTTPTGKVGSIGNLVFEDKNFNGIQDAGEKGIAGVTVKLTNNAGTVLATTTTDTNGAYLFSNLGAGDYKVQVGAPTGYFVTKSDQGSDDTVDSDLLATGSTGTITLAAGQSRTDVDAGLYRKASLGDRVWSDANHNGVQDNGEGGIGGIKVSLLNAAGTTVLASTTTDSNGNYLFSGLNPGDYVVQFDKTNVVFKPSLFSSFNLNTWSWSAKDAGANDGADSDVNNAGTTAGTARTGVINLESGESDNTVDAGLTPIVIDLDGNGIQTVSRENAGGTFDLFGNGTAVASGWVGKGDGLLAVDKNGNGRIDDITELFGGTSQGAGFAQLAAYDSNGDGRVDSADADFGKLLVWVDANGNHATDAGELQSLAQAGLASLSTGFTNLPALDDQGNLHLERGSATRTDGSTVDMTDVYFNVSVADADAAGVALPTIAQLLGDDSALDSLLASSGLSAAPTVGASAVGADLMACGEAAELLRHLSALTQAETHMAMAA